MTERQQMVAAVVHPWEKDLIQRAADEKYGGSLSNLVRTLAMEEALQVVRHEHREEYERRVEEEEAETA